MVYRTLKGFPGSLGCSLPVASIHIICDTDVCVVVIITQFIGLVDVQRRELNYRLRKSTNSISPLAH